MESILNKLRLACNPRDRCHNLSGKGKKELSLFKYSSSNYFTETTYQEFAGKSSVILVCPSYDSIVFAANYNSHNYKLW